jgi:atypical dual specificity phosphatase
MPGNDVFTLTAEEKKAIALAKANYESNLKKRIGNHAMAMRTAAARQSRKELTDAPPTSFNKLSDKAGGEIIAYPDLGGEFTTKHHVDFVGSLGLVRADEALGVSLKSPLKGKIITCNIYDLVFFDKTTGGKIYLGSAPTYEQDFPSGVNTVISCIRDKEAERHSFVKAEEWQEKGVKIIRTPIEDFSSKGLDNDRLDELAAHIKADLDQGKSIYVHCKAGRSRSASAIIAYYMRYEGLTLVQAHDLINAQRPVSVLGESQWKIMIEYEKHCALRTERMLDKIEQLTKKLDEQNTAITALTDNSTASSIDTKNQLSAAGNSIVVATAKAKALIVKSQTEQNPRTHVRIVAEAEELIKQVSTLSEIISSQTEKLKLAEQEFNNAPEGTANRTRKKINLAAEQSITVKRVNPVINAIGVRLAATQEIVAGQAAAEPERFTNTQRRMIDNFYIAINSYLAKCYQSKFSRHGGKGWKRGMRMLNAFRELAATPSRFPKTPAKLKTVINTMLKAEGLEDTNTQTSNNSVGTFLRFFGRKENNSSLRRTMKTFIETEDQNYTAAAAAA